MTSLRPRVKNDFYPTSQALTLQLLKRVNIYGTILECCAGDGAIASLLPNCITNDPHPSNGYEPDFQLDATSPQSWQSWNQVDWVITNPPFSLAPSILPLALLNAKVGVAALLRLSYLEPCANRGQWLQEYSDRLSNLIIFSPRPKFRKDTKGVDSVTVAWFVWQHRHQGGTQIELCNNWKQGGAR